MQVGAEVESNFDFLGAINRDVMPWQQLDAEFSDGLLRCDKD
jgi:hypothetical protein